MIKPLVASLTIAVCASHGAAARTYRFSGTAVSQLSPYKSVTGTLTVPDDFTLSAGQFGFIRATPYGGSVEAFGARRDGGIDRGFFAFAPVSFEQGGGGFYLGGALGGINYRGLNFADLPTRGGTEAIFDLSNFTSVVLNVGGAEDQQPVYGPGRLSGGSFDLTRLALGVPEPAGWAMMIAGFALIGATSRGRRIVDVRRIRPLRLLRGDASATQKSATGTAAIPSL